MAYEATALGTYYAPLVLSDEQEESGFSPAPFKLMKGYKYPVDAFIDQGVILDIGNGKKVSVHEGWVRVEKVYDASSPRTHCLFNPWTVIFVKDVKPREYCDMTGASGPETIKAGTLMTAFMSSMGYTSVVDAHGSIYVVPNSALEKNDKDPLGGDSSKICCP